MATHIILVNFTDQGALNAKTSPDRIDSFTKLAESFGVKVESAHYTAGAYDIVVLMEGSDDAVATAVLSAGTSGNVRSQTLRAFSVDQMRSMVDKLT